MKIKVWTLTSDTDSGMQTGVFTTERAAYEAFNQSRCHAGKRIEADEVDRAESLLNAAIQTNNYTDLDEFLQSTLEGTLDSYSVEEHELEIPEEAKPEKSEPMECPFCHDGTLQFRSDAYEFYNVSEIKTTVHEPTEPGRHAWEEYDVIIQGEPWTNSFDDSHVVCNNCDEEGGPQRFAQKAAKEEEEDDDETQLTREEEEQHNDTPSLEDEGKTLGSYES